MFKYYILCNTQKTQKCSPSNVPNAYSQKRRTDCQMKHISTIGYSGSIADFKRQRSNHNKNNLPSHSRILQPKYTDTYRTNTYTKVRAYKSPPASQPASQLVIISIVYTYIRYIFIKGSIADRYGMRLDGALFQAMRIQYILDICVYIL